MKNRFIERKLNSYVEAVKPNDKLIEGAVLALRQKRLEGNTSKVSAYRSNKRGLAIGLSVAAACALLLVGIFLSQLIFPAKPQSYALADLTYNTASIEVIEQETSVLTIDIDDMYTNGRIYLNEKKEHAVVSVLYKAVGEGGLDEIVVIADLKGGLKDYSDFKKYTKKADINGIEVRLMETRQNGEYYTNAYFSFKGIDYYVKIMSPVKDGVEYISLLLKT